MAREGTDYQLLAENLQIESMEETNNTNQILDLDLNLAAQVPEEAQDHSKESPPPKYELKDPSKSAQADVEDPDDQDSGGSTQEYQSSRAIDPDLFEEDVENEAMGLQPAKAIGHDLRFTKSARLLFMYGLMSVGLGVAIIFCGIASFALVPQLQSRHSFKVEWKWTNLVLIFSGLGAILLVRRQTLTAICATLIFSLIATCMGVCTFIVHIVNLYFRRKDIAYYNAQKPEMAEQAKSVGNLNLAIMLMGLVSSILSALVYRHSLHITGKNFGYTIHVDKHRLRLSMLGLSQLITGLLITAWWAGIETIFHGKNVDFHALPTSEVLAHGLVIAITGYVQMMATAKGSQPLLVCAAALNGASLFLATFFSSRPLSMIYLVLEHSSSTMEDSFDIRFAMCAILCLFYIVEIMFAVYSLIKFVHLAAGDRISRIDNLLEHPRRLFLILSGCQIFIGILYAILEIIAVSLMFLYKLDFSPLPLFIIVSGIFSYGAVRMGSSMLITISSATASVCTAFALRDIYLFGYHSISHGLTPDNPTSIRMSGPNLATHFVIAVVAVIEIILACAMQLVFLRVLVRSVAGLFNKIEFPKVTRYLRLATISQIIIATLIIVFGLVIFLSRTKFLVVFGDYSLTHGLLLLGSGILTLFIIRKPILLLPSVATQLVVLTLIWQQSDEFAYLITNYLDAPETVAPSHGMISLSFMNFALFVAYFCLSGLSVLLQGAILEGTRFMKLDPNPRKMEELVSMGPKQRTVTTELGDLAAEEQKNGHDVLIDA